MSNRRWRKLSSRRKGSAEPTHPTLSPVAARTDLPGVRRSAISMCASHVDTAADGDGMPRAHRESAPASATTTQLTAAAAPTRIVGPATKEVSIAPVLSSDSAGTQTMSAPIFADEVSRNERRKKGQPRPLA